ncbi:MAG TPA: SGNH/GDSL hydrolase family protein [Iamia sp.]|nr:SGNH/GDSL hydrolase family protein [Iamia sp.]
MRLSVLVLVLVLGAAAVVGYLDWRAGDDSPHLSLALAKADVLVIGDSVTDQSSDQITAAMPDREVTVIGLSGLRTDQLRPVIEDTFRGVNRPSVGVVMAGYNDVWQGTEREAPIDELVAVMAEVDCAVWVLVPTKGPWEHERALAFDARIRAAADAAGVAVDTRWRDAVDRPDGPAPDPDLVQDDDVHPSEAGRLRVAEVMAAAVEDHCR